MRRKRGEENYFDNFQKFWSASGFRLLNCRFANGFAKLPSPEKSSDLQFIYLTSNILLVIFGLFSCEEN